MYIADFFIETGFDPGNIPSSPDLLYDENIGFDYITVRDMNPSQDGWITQLKVLSSDISIEEARKVDYVVVYDEDDEEEHGYDWLNRASCYTVLNYAERGGTILFTLLYDAHTSIGGFEEGSGNEIISGSANRLSVPLVSNELFTSAEDNTFYGLDEPFRPSNILKKSWIGSIGPGPTPPPVPPVADNIGFMNSPDYHLTAPLVWGFSSRNWLNSTPPWPEHVLSSDCCNVAGFQISVSVNPWDYEFNYGAQNVKNDIITWLPQFKVQHPEISEDFYNYMVLAAQDYCNSGEIEAAIEKFEDLRDEAPDWSQCSIRSFVRYIRENGGQYANPTGFYKTLAIYKGSTTVFEETHYYRASLSDPWTVITNGVKDENNRS